MENMTLNILNQNYPIHHQPMGEIVSFKLKEAQYRLTTRRKAQIATKINGEIVSSIKYNLSLEENA